MTEKIGGKCKSAAQTLLFTGGCALAGGVIGAAEFFYRYALTPKKHDPRLDRDPLEKEYAAGRSWLNGHPHREDVYIHGDDGLQLHGNFIPAQGGTADGAAKAAGRAPEERREEHRYAICVHGYADAAESMGLYARVYHDRYGMHVLVPDLRGHGRSDGDYVGMGYDDSFDLLRWIDWVLEKDPAARIVLHGVSMGAAAVLLTTGHSLPSQVKAAVADTAYTSAFEELTLVYEQIKGAVIPAPVMLESVRLITLLRAGYDLKKASPLQAVGHSGTPTLFIHGQADDVIPSRMMPALYRAASCPKSFQWIPEAGHAKSVVRDPETYWTRVERFLHADDVGLY